MSCASSQDTSDGTDDAATDVLVVDVAPDTTTPAYDAGFDAGFDSGAPPDMDSGPVDTGPDDFVSDAPGRYDAPPDAPNDADGSTDTVVCDFAGDAGGDYVAECIAAQALAGIIGTGTDCNPATLGCPTGFCCGAPFCPDPNSSSTAVFLCIQR
jgi:hypothetical protein